jgi:hypothetical protein
VTRLEPGETRDPWPSSVKSRESERRDTGAWKKRIPTIETPEATARVAIRSSGRNRHR